MGKCLFMRKGETHTAPVTGILAGDLAVGSSVYLMENGVAVEYLVVNQGIPSGSSLYDASCDGLWLLRKAYVGNLQWYTTTSATYEKSSVHNYLNTTFYNTLGTVEKELIKQVKIPWYESSSVLSGANGLSTKVFLLGGYEVGFSQSVSRYFPVDGAKLDYFISGIETEANTIRKAYNSDGLAADRWWLRTRYAPNSGNVYAWVVNERGSNTRYGIDSSSKVRPALILPSNALFDKNTMLLMGVK